MTTTTLTLSDFLLAQIAKDEATARAASVGPWTHDDADGEVYHYSKALHSGWLISHPQKVADAEHIARHDPARVLAECEAKRRIVRAHPDYGGYGESCQTCAESDIDQVPWPCPTLRALALPYADHPDYREEWKP